ncbi:nucleoid-associated protein [Streptomyces sp. NBC_00201]|uniref:nucleoid-associated protein n=1 Tax=Streptomyces sp. NBC_00201 TaxID=2975679 RepID=UPI00225938EA|nr:nucleoid-associated protein [Streptomyces sp. NBC_00201]MCX5248941.1 nucleoid-associated protein [Streptomyces sp. NBC_00201]
MRTDFGDLVIEKAIVHVVPQRKRSDPNEPIPLSEAPCNLNDAVRTALQARLRGVLASTGREVIEDPDSKSALPDRVYSFLSGEINLVDVSVEMVHLLRNSQSGVNSAGLLLVAEAGLAGQRALLIVKLEQETGMQATETFVNGLRTFDMKYLADLLFTEKSKIHKVALFPEGGINDERIEGWAADRQLSGKMAAFFLERFLGCRQKNEPREVTRRFHDAATEWVNIYIADPDVRINYLMATLTELQSPAQTLDPIDFAQRHLDVLHRDSFIECLEGAEVPARAFDKDTEHLENKLRNMRVGFANGVFVVAPVDAMDDHEVILLEDQGDGTTSVTITGTVTTATAYAPPGGRRRSKQGDSDERKDSGISQSRSPRSE